MLTSLAISCKFRPLSLVGHLKTTGRQEMLHLELGQRLFLLLSTSLVEESEMLLKYASLSFFFLLGLALYRRTALFLQPINGINLWSHFLN